MRSAEICGEKAATDVFLWLLYSISKGRIAAANARWELPLSVLGLPDALISPLLVLRCDNLKCLSPPPILHPT
jgi:hypothetical protein